jgi:hypothetical protein
MEIEKDFASKGVAGTALGLGAGALGVQLLNGGLGGLFGGRMGEVCCHEDHHVNRYEASQSARIAELETEIKLRDANVYTLGEMGKLRDYVDKKFDAVNTQLCQQAVINSQITANIGCMQGQIAVLNGLTKTVIPITSVCPEPMPQYNSWTAPTAAAAG